MASESPQEDPGSLLSLNGLNVTAVPRPSNVATRWFDCVIDVECDPFSGRLATILTGDDLREFATALEGLDPEGTAVLGGGRAVELRLVAARQQGGTPGSLALQCSLCPSGDDPWPKLSFLIFDVAPSFASDAAIRLRALAATKDWPGPDHEAKKD